MITNAQLVNNMKAIVEVVKEIGGSNGSDQKLIEDELSDYIKYIGAEKSNS